MLNAFLTEAGLCVALPEGFRRVSLGHGRVMWIAGGHDETSIAREILMPSGRSGTEPQYAGRAALQELPLVDGSIGLVRSYRHGGLFRHWNRNWFLTWPPRPLRELMVTEKARQRGLLTLDVVAAFVAYGFHPFYRGWLVTRELRHAEDLWRVVSSDSSRSKAALMGRVGKAVRFMHDAGVYHRDLNMRNLLVTDGSHQVFVIDFDKARVFERPVSPTLRRRNVARLLRSIQKLDPGRRHVSAEDWESFLVAYHE